MVNRWSKRAGGLSRRKSATGIKLGNADTKRNGGAKSPAVLGCRKFRRYQRSQAETGRIEGHARDRRGRLAGFVEHQLQRVAVQQVDAVEGRVLRRGGDLRNDLVVLADQRRTRGLRHRIGDWRDGSSERRSTGRRANG